MSEPILEIREVHTYYGHVHALKGISLSIEPGEIVALIGANGAGKTTTLRTVSGLLRPRDGDILINGKSLKAIPAHEIVFMGVSHAPEGRKIFSTLTVKENLNMGAYTLSNKARIEEHREARLHAVPAAQGTAQPARRHPLRRRAADAGHRPGADVRPQGAAARRTVARPRPAPGARHLRHRTRDQPLRHHDPPGRAKRPRRARSWRTRATCWKPAASCSPGRRRRCWRTSG